MFRRNRPASFDELRIPALLRQILSSWRKVACCGNLIWNDLSSQLVGDCASTSSFPRPSRSRPAERAPHIKGARGAGRVCRPVVPVEAPHRWWSTSQSRRLITLIFAGRNRIIVIRRELPRTNGAGRAHRLPHRLHEDSPFRVPLDHHRCCASGPCLWAAGVAYAATTVVCRSLPSTCLPIAQMNPKSSRLTAVTTCCLHFPRAVNRR